MCSPSAGASISSQIVGRNPASVLPAPVAATSSAARPRRAASSISSWCRRGCQPRAANQSLRRSRVSGTVRHSSHYMAAMARLGTWIEPFPEGIYVKPADAWVDPSQPKAAGAGHPRPRRPCARRPWRGVGDARDAGDHGRRATASRRAIRSPMAKRSGSARSTSASSPPAMCWARRRSCSIIAASGWWCRATTSAAPDPTCAPFVVDAVRHLHHRGDLRPAGVPPSRHRQRDRPAAPPPARRAGALRAGRRLCAGQGAAGDRRAARRAAMTSRSTIHGAMERLCRLYEELGVPLGELRPGDRRDQGGAGRARSSSARRARSTTAGRGGCPTR